MDLVNLEGFLIVQGPRAGSGTILKRERVTTSVKKSRAKMAGNVRCFFMG